MSNVQPGKHVARAESFEFGTTEKGTEYIAVVFKIAEGDATGQRLTWRGFFSEKARERTIAALRYCGWTGGNFAKIDGLDRKLVELDIEDNEYNGKTYSKIKWVNRLGGASSKEQMSPAALADFAARMNCYAQDSAGQEGDVTEPVAAGADDFDQAPPPNDDDNPF